MSSASQMLGTEVLFSFQLESTFRPGFEDLAARADAGCRALRSNSSKANLDPGWESAR